MTPRWYPLDEIPYERMYEADRYWMPIVVAGHKIRANVYYLGRAEKFDHIEIFPFKMS
jgi:8-oxo-dGTP diphosphatase